MVPGPMCTDDLYMIHTLSHKKGGGMRERRADDDWNTRRTFCDNMSSRASGALGSSIGPICTLGIDRPWTKSGRSVRRQYCMMAERDEQNTRMSFPKHL